jgi:tRNA A37 threonylcarbamoyladenosine biosynthesis protein TsaE
VGDGTPIRVLLHADVYRLDRLHEIVELGLGELVEDGGVALVEWGDAAEPVLGSGALAVRLDMADDDDRRVITISPVDGAWSGRWDGLVRALGSWRAEP